MSFSLQTNGVLLDDQILDDLATEDIRVSLSIDGPQSVHDRHRLDHKRRSSFKAVEAALTRLEARPAIYLGVIAVIDPFVSPDELFEFFDAHRPPQLDFLLPDANHTRLPPARDRFPDIYESWLIRAFDLWFDKYPHLSIRTFDAILNSLVGLPSETDAFGFGDVSLLTIETDGSYHDLDVLKTTFEGATSLGIDLDTATITAAAVSRRIAEHRALLRLEGLSPECQSCPVVDVCGGGSVPHRYSFDGFLHPTVYCREMLSLITHAKGRVAQQLADELGGVNPFLAIEIDMTDLELFEHSETSGPLIERFLLRWAVQARREFESVLQFISHQDPSQSQFINSLQNAPVEVLDRLVLRPSVVLWTNVMQQAASGHTVRSIDGDVIVPDTQYVGTIVKWLNESEGVTLHVHRDDPWLRFPFGKHIVFEDNKIAHDGAKVLFEALSLIKSWRPELLAEIQHISPEIQFIRDLSADPDKLVSFSDNSVPGALYVSICSPSGYISPYDLADSLIHEHRHQKLYLLQREARLVEVDAPLVRSPWREDLRPPSGLLHAVFVFTYLLEFWEHLVREGPAPIQVRAQSEVDTYRRRLKEAIPILKSTHLSPTGIALVDVLAPKALGQ